MSKPRILVQLDTDSQPSVFDSVVAVDAGVEQLFRHQGVTAETVRDLVHGAMFTRGGDDLSQTAIFVGGSDVAAAEALAQAVTECFFGPVRVSVMLDPSGANTTAAAAVLAAARHLSLAGSTATVLGATGPVGRRVVRLLAREGAIVRAVSRSKDRAESVCQSVAAAVEGAQLTAHESGTTEGLAAAMDGAQLVIAAGAAGVELLSAEQLAGSTTLRVAIDLNAVPPAGIGGIGTTDKAVEQAGAGSQTIVCYGALGVGGTKMKIHKAAIKQLFSSNDQVLDAEEIFAVGQGLE